MNRAPDLSSEASPKGDLPPPRRAKGDYFREPDRRAALRAECRRWIGTPFRQRAAVPGPLGGVDCAGFVGGVFHAIGAIPQRIAVPPYDVNHARHSDESVLRAWFQLPEVRARVRLLDHIEPALDGDIVFPRVGRVEHHLGIWVSPDVYHVVRPSGVCAMTLAQLKLHPGRYRLTEPAA